MTQRKVTIALGGLIRQPWFFLKCLEPLVAMRREGLAHRILFATWDTELARHPDIAAVCRQNGVELLGLPEPPVKMGGNYIHQIRVVRAVTDRCGADEFLLRARGDVLFDNPDGLRRLLRHPLELGALAPLPPVFRNRVWVPSTVLLSPFHVWDAAMFGRADDIARLYAFDIGEDAEIDWRAKHTVPVETRLGSRPFVDAFPVLAAWRRLVVAGRMVIGPPHWESDLALGLGSPLFRAVLATYWLILHRYFLLGGSGYDGGVLLGRDGATLGPLLPESQSIVTHDVLGGEAIDHDRFAANLVIAPGLRQRAYVASSDWFARLFEGDQFGESEAVAPYLVALGRSLAVDDRAGRSREAEALLDRIFAAG
jgi:hypothetical protein